MQELFALVIMTLSFVFFCFILAITIRVYQALTIYVIKNSEYYYSPYAIFINKVKLKRSIETAKENDFKDKE